MCSVTDPTQVDAAYTLLNNQLGGALLTGGRDVARQPRPDQQHPDRRSCRRRASAAARDAVTQSIEIIRKRIDALGTKEPDIRQQGAEPHRHRGARRERPGEAEGGDRQDRQADLPDGRHRGRPPRIVTAGRIPPDDVVLPSDDGVQPVLCGQAAGRWSTGEHADPRPAAAIDQNNAPGGGTSASTAVGAQRFGQVTHQNVGKPFAIVLDNRVISAPSDQLGPITGGSGQITGNFTDESAPRTGPAAEVRGAAGAAERDRGAHGGRRAGGRRGAGRRDLGLAIGAALIFVFIILAYGLFGVFAAIALVVNVLMIFGACRLTQATLTLPGIAGLILTMAVAVDANVLIYERMRDEANAGRGRRWRPPTPATGAP